jgi:hypothetical protein
MLTYNNEKVEEMVLALLYLTSSRDQFATRAWKGLPTHVLEKLFRMGYISDPSDKSPSLILSEEAATRSKELFFKFFDAKE